MEITVKIPGCYEEKIQMTIHGQHSSQQQMRKKLTLPIKLQSQ